MHRSVMTGTMDPLHNKSWLKDPNDSMESYLEN